MKKVAARRVPVKIVGSCRFVVCPRKGVLGSGYHLATNCKNCGYFSGMDVKRNKFDLIENGDILCTYGERWRGRNFGKEPEAG